MLAVLIIIVATLFFLGLGLMISTNIAIILTMAFVGLIIGGVIGFFLLQGEPSNSHWSVFAGPVATGLLFMLSCGVLNLLLGDNVGLTLENPVRVFTVVFLLGTPFGLILGYIFGENMSGAIRVKSERGPDLSVQESRQTLTHQKRRGDTHREREPTTPAPRSSLLPPPSIGGESMQSIASINDLVNRLTEEQTSLTVYGQVQVLDLQDGTVCVVVTRPRDGLKVYMVCRATYPQTPPSVTVEPPGQPAHGGILFRWNDATHRLKDIVSDWMGRLD